jgi:hypothetical protein
MLLIEADGRWMVEGRWGGLGARKKKEASWLFLEN